MRDYYAFGNSSNYAQTSDPQVKAFRTAYSEFAPDSPLAEWSLEGYGAGLWFADAARACGAALTRRCVEAYVDTQKGYGGHGLLDPDTVTFPRNTSRPSHASQCYTVVKWHGGGTGTWSTVADHRHDCFTTATFTYN